MSGDMEGKVALGIRGNSHMIMVDRNNLQIANLIPWWIDGHVQASGAGTPVATP
jgi:hypothetical protein